ncbi:hypothetical protein HPP92_003107 [Vanilla planifolia]|uniref:Inositol-pentakisphosphate 2-kinase n=1 Tax=Vanilla planifolia TaxID=51239 RepID=A0A835VJ39_VANPL|nr:hypothetical protein HPP92_003107 [Vanilla planifolia]
MHTYVVCLMWRNIARDLFTDHPLSTLLFWRVMELVLREEDAKDWVYKGEGAASIVLSYIGHSVFLLGKVLRIRKGSRGRSKLANGCSFLSEHETLLWKSTEELVESTTREIVEQVFMMRVMGPLLDTKHVDEGILVIVSYEFLDSVAKCLHHQRPPWRIDVSDVDTFCNFAMLFSNHSVIMRSPGTLIEDVCFAVEIKPKCGFLPDSEFIANRNAVKKHVTRFRMHQTLKLHKGEVNFIDLDMKPLEKMVYYYELDQKIVNFFANHNHNVVTYCNSTDILDEGKQLQH